MACLRMPNPKVDDCRRSLNCACFSTCTTLGMQTAPTSGSGTGIPSRKLLPPPVVLIPIPSRSPRSRDTPPTTVPRPVSTTPAVKAPTAASGNGRRPCSLRLQACSPRPTFRGTRPIFVMGGTTWCWARRMRRCPASRNGGRCGIFISGSIRMRGWVRGWCTMCEV